MKPVKESQAEKLAVKIFNSRKEKGRAAARNVAGEINKLLQIKSELNIVFAAAPSQNEFLDELIRVENVAWQKINAFHMDEYLGIDRSAEQSFGKFLSAVEIHTGKEL